MLCCDIYFGEVTGGSQEPEGMASRQRMVTEAALRSSALAPATLAGAKGGDPYSQKTSKEDRIAPGNRIMA